MAAIPPTPSTNPDSPSQHTHHTHHRHRQKLALSQEEDSCSDLEDFFQKPDGIDEAALAFDTENVDDEDDDTPDTTTIPVEDEAEADKLDKKPGPLADASFTRIADNAVRFRAKKPKLINNGKILIGCQLGTGYFLYRYRLNCAQERFLRLRRALI